MAKLFNITLPAESANLRLHPKQRATVTYTVSNLSGRRVRGRATLKPDDLAVRNRWVTLCVEEEKEYEPCSTFQFSVTVRVPPGATPGKYTFRLDAVNADIPDEGDHGPVGGLEILDETPLAFPKWIIPVGATVVLLIAAALTWLLWPKDSVTVAADSSPRVATPALPSISTRRPVRRPTPAPTAAPTPAPTPAPASANARGACKKGFVRREVAYNDNVCVTPAVRQQVLLDNSQAAFRVDPLNRTYGPDTCRQGYVWREAMATDHVCVEVTIRQQAASDNALGPSRRADEVRPRAKRVARKLHIPFAGR